ncbi:MAG: flagellar assembly protein FliW [Alphaproteobacteria bacterium]|nr:flagellar assembly protein FliW [Alphaproteobacteria bacterium]
MLQTITISEITAQLEFPVIVESRFGDLVIREEDLLSFPNGIYGFEDYNSYALTNFAGQTLTDFRVLQCLDEIGLVFILTPLTYQGTKLVNENDLLEAADGLNIPMENCDFFAITTVSESPQGLQFQLNLKAPIVIDNRSRQAFQYILQNTDYPVNHKIAINT